MRNVFSIDLLRLANLVISPATTKDVPKRLIYERYRVTKLTRRWGTCPLNTSLAIHYDSEHNIYKLNVPSVRSTEVNECMYQISTASNALSIGCEQHDWSEWKLAKFRRKIIDTWHPQLKPRLKWQSVNEYNGYKERLELSKFVHEDLTMFLEEIVIRAAAFSYVSALAYPHPSRLEKMLMCGPLDLK